MIKTTKAIETKALERINKKRVEQGIKETTIDGITADLKATKIRDEYRAAMVDEALAQAEIDLGEKS